MRVREATSTTARMKTIDRSSSPIQRSSSHATATAAAVAATMKAASRRSGQPVRGPKPRRERARAPGELMMTSS